jgi:hypothetical protein
MMRRTQTAAISAAIAFFLKSLVAVADVDHVKFPGAGTPYAEARAMLMRQGVMPVPRMADHHDRRFRELDCATGSDYYACRAVFIHRQQDGWRVYVMVYTDKGRNVVEADYPKPPENLLSLPPPIPKNMPPVRGDYLRARARLKALGFKPAERGDDPQWICLDRKCRRHVEVREVQCAADVPLCTAFWTARDGRVLRVDLIGESNPRIRFMEWATRKDLQEFLQ